MLLVRLLFFFFFKQKTAYEITYGDWSSDVCSSDLELREFGRPGEPRGGAPHPQLRPSAGRQPVRMSPGHGSDNSRTFMPRRISFRFIGVLLCALALPFRPLAQPAAVPPPGMARLPGGVYRPFFRSGSDAKELPVRAFALDILPVTNAEFLAFVRANPRWRRSQVKRLFSDEHYLKHWAGDLDPGEAAATNAPVTWISWFAAKAYAAWAGKRLPTTAEWELAAGASPTRPDGGQDAECQKKAAAR